MNGLIFLYIKKFKPKMMTIKYENLCRKTKQEINKLKQFLDIDNFEINKEKIRKMTDYHNFGGNRLAMLKNRQTFSGVFYDERWRKNMSLTQKIFSSPFHILYKFL
jgi:hypothetical protein